MKMKISSSKKCMSFKHRRSVTGGSYVNFRNNRPVIHQKKYRIFLINIVENVVEFHKTSKIYC